MESGLSCSASRSWSWPPGHLHRNIPALQFHQHLRQALLPRLQVPGACDLIKTSEVWQTSEVLQRLCFSGRGCQRSYLALQPISKLILSDIQIILCL
jgi:hypothetical protein